MMFDMGMSVKRLILYFQYHTCVIPLPPFHTKKSRVWEYRHKVFVTKMPADKFRKLVVVQITLIGLTLLYHVQICVEFSIIVLNYNYIINLEIQIYIFHMIYIYSDTLFSRGMLSS